LVSEGVARPEAPTGWGLSVPACSGFPAEASPRAPPQLAGAPSAPPLPRKSQPHRPTRRSNGGIPKMHQIVFFLCLGAFCGVGAEFEIGFRILVSVSVSNSSATGHRAPTAAIRVQHAYYFLLELRGGGGGASGVVCRVRLLAACTPQGGERSKVAGVAICLLRALAAQAVRRRRRNAGKCGERLSSRLGHRFRKESRPKSRRPMANLDPEPGDRIRFGVRVTVRLESHLGCRGPRLAP